MLLRVEGPSPTAAGFRLIFRRPEFPLAELAWRWSFGATALAAAGFISLEYLDSLPVSNAERFFLRSGHPFLVSQAIAHILRGSAPRLVAAIVLAGLALTAAWIALACIGRSATVQAILRQFDREFPADVRGDAPEVVGQQPERRGGFQLRALFDLNFLRAATALAALVGWFGAFIVAGTLSPENASGPALAMLIFGVVIVLLGLAWSATNWFISMGTIFAVRDGLDTFGALSAAADFCRDRLGTVFAIGTWFGLAHLGAFVIGTGLSFTVLIFAGVVPPGFVILGAAFVAAIYFAIADFLYTGRLVAYLFAIEGLDRPVVPPKPPSLTEPGGYRAPSIPVETSVDQTEAILSDRDLILSDDEVLVNS